MGNREGTGGAWVAPLVTTVFGLLYLVASVLVLTLMTSAEMAPMRWAIGVPLLLLGVANLALLPRFRRDRLPPDEEFLDVDAEGRPTVGTPQVRRIAEAMHAMGSGLPRIPLQIQTSPLAVRVAASTRLPGPAGASRRWRTTLVPTPDPDVFVRLDQTWDSASGAGWGSVGTSMGSRIGGSVTIEIDRDGITTSGATRIPDPSLAVRAAVRQAGVRLATPTAALIGIVNGVGCLLLTISILIGVLLYL